MIVKQPTRLWLGAANRCLDHIYSTNPEKLSEPEVIWTGLSDHAFVKVKRFTMSMERRPRYIMKRMFKIPQSGYYSALFTLKL